MEIVIDIPDKLYEYIVKGKDLSEEQNDEMALAIADGKPLPEHHGRLIDADALYDSAKLCHTEEDGTACVEWREINDAPTIVEAEGRNR